MARMPDDAPRLEALNRDECLRRLATQSVGRIGITVRALPVVLPVNFGLLGESIVFRTTPGTKLDAATNKTVVAFEADSYEPDGRSGWSVLVIGRAMKMPADEVADAEALVIDAWPLDGQASHFVCIEGSQISGRRFNR
jgi:nitroimidazol reductase NimA-like FMN-containing flavoprotein (pyridoxamine 5'-phosphate oxidase superfamily)